MFDFNARKRPGGVSLTPMIDVVFLLLVFFMLVGRFGLERPLPLQLGGAGGAYSGPPRLIDVAPGGLRLNGVAMEDTKLLIDLVRLTDSGADIIVLRPAEGAAVERLVAVMDLLGRAGFENLAIVSPGE